MRFHAGNLAGEKVAETSVARLRSIAATLFGQPG